MLADDPTLTPIAGCTDVLVGLHFGTLDQRRFIDLWPLDELRGIPGVAAVGLTSLLPIGGGMGGGSSDAATVLIVLNRMWDLRLSRAELLELAVVLGADVPGFVFGGNALGVFDVTLLGFVYDDALKLFFLVEEVGYIEKRIALEPNVNKG